MKLEDCVDINKVTVSQIGEQVAYDTETTYYGLSQRKNSGIFKSTSCKSL